ncbi:MAG TPA: hypothetical protein VFT06_12450, partial [Flavisolibacter sp.]|nr:hypothetical protein [Flavisolibacter sp.]
MAKQKEILQLYDDRRAWCFALDWFFVICVEKTFAKSPSLAAFGRLSQKKNPPVTGGFFFCRYK